MKPLAMGLGPMAAPWLDVPRPLKNPLGGMPLLAVPAEVFQQPLVDEAGETVQLGPLDLRRAPIAGRH